jgi:hypothetical protein
VISHHLSGIIICISMIIFMSSCNDASVKTSTAIQKDLSLCQFSMSPCTKMMGELSVTVNLSPGSVPSEKPLHFELLTNMNVTNLQVRLEGRDMFMGIIPVNIRETAKNHYEGSIIYGSCSSGFMVWRVWVNFDYQGAQHSLSYDFLADVQAKSS